MRDPEKTAEAEAKRNPDHQSGCQSCGSEQRKNRVQRPPKAGVGTSSGSDDTKSTESVREVIGEKDRNPGGAVHSVGG